LTLSIDLTQASPSYVGDVAAIVDLTERTKLGRPSSQAGHEAAGKARNPAASATDHRKAL
jgi:hypothetical protein